MGYAPSMSSGFIYHPHVHQSDGTVVTPDIAITRIFASGPDRLAPVQVSRLTSAAVIQQAAEGSSVPRRLRPQAAPRFGRIHQAAAPKT